MTHKKTKGQRLFALLLAMALLMSSISTAAFAADIGGADAADVLLSDAEQETATEVAPDTPFPDDLTEGDTFADADVPDDESQEDESTDDAPSDEQPVEDEPQEDDQTGENDQGDDQVIETPQESDTVPDAGDDAPADTQPRYDYDEPVQDGAPDELTDEDFSGNPLQIMIEAYGYVYAETLETAMIYSSADRLDDEHIFTITNTAVLLATEYAQRDDGNSVKVWFIAQSGETLTGYVAESALSGLLFSDEDMELLTENLWAFLIPTEAGELTAFVVDGEKPFADEAVIPDLTPETPPETETDSPGDEAAPLAQVGDFVAVTTRTRAFLGVDNYAMDTGYGDLGVGSFVRDGIVQIESIETDYYGRAWYKIRYMFMYDDGPGLEYSESRYVLAAETYPTDAQGLTDTYYLMSEADRAALSVMPLTFYPSSTSFNLVNAYGEIKSVSLYDFDVWADSDSRDVNKHPAIAKCDDIDGGYAFAYPHTFNYSNAWVYCIEHNYNAPTSRNDGDTGPYVTVDWEGYTLRKSAGQSHIYSGKTMHAIAWSVFHSWPFKKVTVSGESADDINFWSFCAGQIAIREIIGQMEGRQYIRDGWDLSEFYRFKDCAPSDYLNYARWLVSNAVSYAQQFDDNDCSATINSITKSGSNYVANITVRSTNGQKVAIKKEDFIVSVSGTIGSEQAWYYVSDGSTVNVTISKMPATLELGLVGDSDDECGWVIAVPNGVSLQRLFVPQEGNPLAITATKIPLEMPAGEIQVTKKNTSGALLSGATFELLGSGGSVLKTQTTGTNGVTTFTDLDPGTYTVREKGAPTGYLVSVPNTQSAAVTAGSTTKVTFTNEEIKPKIKIVKKDSLTKEPLAGAQFRITRLSGPAGYTGGTQVVATITTGADGTAETGWLGYGKYRIEETVVPQHFVNKNYSTEIEAYENGKTYTIEVENEPSKGYIQITKSDSLDGTLIEGVQFDIYYNDSYGTGLAATMTTDSKGVATSPALRKGKYLVKEHADPQGYVTELVTLEATVTSDTTTKLTAKNEPIRGKIRIVKKDQLTKELLAGAEFTITRVSGLPSHKGSNNGEKVAVITTNADGVAESPLLTWGTYRVTETKVPVHFVDNSFSTDVVIKDENLQTYTIEVENEPSKGYLQLVKTDRLDRTLIEGVQFDIYYNDQFGSGLAATMTTDSKGVATSPPLRKGKYLVKEHADPEGYVTELVTMDAVVKPDETTNLSATNMPIQGKIRIVKKDELTKELLAGAEFTITRVSGLPSHKGSDNGEVVAVIVTGADGIAESPLLTWGTYRVEETKVPEHFVDNSFSTEAVIKDENLQTYEIEVENEPTKGWLRLTKRDRQNGNPIEGVQFDIYYNDEFGSGLAGTMTTGKDGIAMSEPLRKGRYLIREHGETPGYLFEEIEMEATVKSDEITELEATNRHVTVKLNILKRDSDEYGGDSGNTSTRGDGVLTGAVFQVLAGEDIRDRQGNVVYAKGDVVVDSITTTGDQAAALTDELWPGLYEIVELSPPTGYLPSDEHIFIDARDAANQSVEAIITYEGVKLNKIKMGAKAIIKILGDDSGELGAGKLETPEVGAEFNVYLKKAGSYENAREIERDHLVTDENGYAMTKALPYGIYVLEQTAGKAGYEIKAPIDFFIDGSENLLNPPIMALNDRPILYRLKLVKADAETGNTVALAGTSFRLKDSSGEVVSQTIYYPKETVMDTFTTDESGEVTLPETVKWGLYFIEEVRSPEGYLLPDEELAFFVGKDSDKPGETYELSITISNEPVKGRIILEKKGLLLAGCVDTQDFYGNSIQRPVFKEGYLAGAVFELRAAEDVVGADGTSWYVQDELIQTLTTTHDGPVSSMELPLGRYKLVEVDAPDGYIFDDTEYEVELAYADNITPIVEVKTSVSNIYMPVELSLKKVKEVLSTEDSGGIVKRKITTTPGEGFVFGLYNDQDIRYDGGTLFADTLFATAVTDKNGNLTFSGRFPHGEYYVKELYAPIGWKLNPNRFEVSLTTEHQVEDTIAVELDEAVYDEIIVRHVTLTKTDITGENTLPGAMIEVRDDDGNVIYRDYTDEDGEIKDIPITPGRYTFREVWAPDGYALNEARMSFVVDEDGTITGDTTIRDDYTRFSIQKQSDGGEPLAGVEFGLLKEDNSLLLTAVTDENGLATFEKVPYGSYTIVETQPLPGYLSDGTQIQIGVDGTFINPKKPIATVINEKMRLHGRKVDTAGNALPGAEFALIDAATDEVIETATSDELGMFVFEGVAYGDWIIRETVIPDGFIQMEDVLLHIDESWTEPEQTYTFVNVPNHYEFEKVDNRKKPLAGVKFVLEDADGNFICELVSGEDGVVRATGLKLGTYTIREVETVEGFTVTDETIQFTIDGSYAPPQKLKKLKNYPIIQTGVDIPITPLMCAGGGMVIGAVALAAAYIVENKKKSRRKKKKARR